MSRHSSLRTSRFARSPIAGLAAAALVCGGAAACSSSGSSAAAASSSSGSTGTVSLTFGDESPNANLTPVYAAEDQGFFKAAGLDVTIEKFTGGGASSVAALATGAVQITAGGPTGFIGYMAKKVISGKLFAEILDSNYDVVVSKNITSISQLKGKVIGVSGADSSDDIFLMATLEHYGITPSDVTTVTSGTTSERLIALSTGKVQAIADADTERAAEESVGNVIIPSEDNPIKVPGSTFFASNSYIADNSGTLKRFMAVVDKGVAWVRDSANESKAVTDCEQGSGATAAECEQAITTSKDESVVGPWTWSSTSALDTAGIKEAIAATSILVPQAKSLSLGDVVDTAITGTQP